jgi:hypothetical protein
MRFYIHVTIYSLLAVFISIPLFTHAYGLNNIQGEVVVNRGITISNVLLDQVVYSAGDSATLSFEIENTTDTIQSGLTYRVDAVGSFDTTTKEPSTRFTVGNVVELPLLQPKEIHTIEMPYTLPTYGLSQDMGLRISMYNEIGELVRATSIPVLITGIQSVSQQYIAQLQVDGQPFPLLAGPTLHQGERVSFAISLQRSRVARTLTPSVDVYRGLGTFDATIDSFAGATITLSTTRSVEQRIVLPTFEYTPGVYTAVVTYKDTEGVVWAGPFEMRYVVADVRPTLVSALPTTIEANANDTFDVVVMYQNPPKDIQLEATYDPASYVGAMTAEVNVVDAHNVLIGTQRVSFLPGKNDARVSFVAPHYMYGMRIVTTLFEDGVIRDTQDQVLPNVASLSADSAEEVHIDAKQQQGLVAGGVVLVLFIITVLIAIRFHVQKKKL